MKNIYIKGCQVSECQFRPGTEVHTAKMCTLFVSAYIVSFHRMVKKFTAVLKVEFLDSGSTCC